MTRQIGVVLGVGFLLASLVAVASWRVSLQIIGEFLVIRDPLIPVDAVVAISGDGTGERARTASALFRRGYARWFIASGSHEGAAPGGATAAMVRVALGEGVPAGRILIDDQARGTGDNARGSAALMRSRGLRDAILVTSPYHTRRAALVFRSVFIAQGLHVRVFAVEDSFFDVHGWWTRPFHRQLVMREYGKLLGFLAGFD